MAWTKAQQSAIDTTGRNLLVAAAAGSGKTAVLVERIISKLLTGQWEVDRLLVVTFTHAAAEEMRQRVETALRQKLTEEQDETRFERLERQLALLSGASITTLHSFCQTVLRQNFAALDLDPEFRLAGEQELNLIKRDVLEELFENKYLDGDEAFLHFVDAYGGNVRGDDGLYALVDKLYNFSRSQPFPEEWLDNLPKFYRVTAGNGVKDSLYCEAALKNIAMELEGCAEEIKGVLAAIDSEGLNAYETVITEELEMCRNLQSTLATGDWNALRQAFAEVKFSTLRGGKNLDEGQKEAAKLLVQEPRSKYKKILTTLKSEYFTATEDELIENMRLTAPSVETLSRLTKDFAQAFAEAKAKKRLIDFNDLEHFALKILCAGRDDTGKLLPSSVARTLKERFTAVMVDEYQDTNGVQEAIINLVTNEETHNLFCVGDVKQSIYRFRLADPSLFLNKYRQFPLDTKNSAVIDLKQNFRSRKEILSAINYVFVQLMSPGAMEIDYDEAARLYPGADYPPFDDSSGSAAAELAILYAEDQDTDTEPTTDTEAAELTRLELEGQYIADRLKQLIASDYQIFDKQRGECRPMTWRDTVILLRSVKGKGDKLLNILRRNDIPAYVAANAGFFQEQEIKTMLALLKIIDNVRQDIPLATVLASPIGGMDFNELAQLRLLLPEGDLYDALSEASRGEASLPLTVKVRDFLSKLAKWRIFAREKSVPELISDLYNETGYYDFVGGLKGGLVRQANLRLLVNRAAAYEQTDFRGLFRFLHFVERMQDMDTDLAVARTLGESENVVRIMSIHSSKGLEFPVVIVADLGKKFNLQDTSNDILIHRELGVGLYMVDESLSIRLSTLPRLAIAAALTGESKAEELRLLYVALTRAREKLILVGTLADNPNKHRFEWQRFAKVNQARLPDYRVLAGSSFLDWLTLAVARHPDGAELLADDAVPFVDYRDDSHWQVNLVSTKALVTAPAASTAVDELFSALTDEKPLTSTPLKNKVEKLMAWQYNRRGLGEVNAKLSVTEIKRRQEEEDAATVGISLVPPEDESEWARPRFMLDAAKPVATEYGSLMHSVMQHIDFSEDISIDGIKAQLKRMVDAGILREDELTFIGLRKVRGFFVSSLGDRVKNSLRVWRELPFARLYDAQKFFPQVADIGERVLVQGIIDLLFEEEDGLVLVDYKTDKDTSPDKIKLRYQTQIDIYSESAAQITGKKVKERYLYMLHDGSYLAL